jgi:glutaredoxin
MIKCPEPQKFREKGEKNMTDKRKIEVFSAGCPVCEDAVKIVNSIACPSCEVSVLDMKQPEVSEKAKKLGIHAVPAVAIDGKLADCCCGCGLDEAKLKAEGLGKL